MLQDLRNEKLIRQHQKRLQILDLEELQRLAFFDADFLHLRSPNNAAAGFGARVERV